LSDSLPNASAEFSTQFLWDGGAVPLVEQAHLKLVATPTFYELSVRAPFYGDPEPPLAPGSCWSLWDYEVVELFIVGKDDAYIEIELGPHGHHLMLRFYERRKPYESELPLDYRAEIRGGTWEALARLPTELLPPPPHRANVYAIHGQGDSRRYLAAHPVPGENPDFHRLECFPALELTTTL